MWTLHCNRPHVPLSASPAFSILPFCVPSDGRLLLHCQEINRRQQFRFLGGTVCDRWYSRAPARNLLFVSRAVPRRGQHPCHLVCVRVASLPVLLHCRQCGDPTWLRRRRHRLQRDVAITLLVLGLQNSAERLRFLCHA